MSMSGGSNFVDYYALLGVEPTAEIDEIRKAFIIKAKENHPDIGGSTEMMQQLNKAYKTLANSTAKAAYDMLHNFHIGSTEQSEYRYNDGREVKEVTDMSDEEIDMFLDNIFTEYRNGPPKSQQSAWERVKKIINFQF